MAEPAIPRDPDATGFTLRVQHVFGVLPPGQSPGRWHVSPVVDVLAYHFSWLPMLLWLWWLGPEHPRDYLVPFVIVTSMSFAHRHVTIPYVFFDPHIREQHPYAFGLLPAVMAVLFVLTPAVFWWRVEPGQLGVAHVLAALVAAAFAVQVWSDAGAEVGPSWRRVLAAAAPLVAVGLGEAAGPDVLSGWWWLGAWLLASGVVAHGSGRWAVPALCVGLSLTGLMAGGPVGRMLPTQAFTFRVPLQALAIFVALWNLWHTGMQKFGILRIYNAKSAAPWDDKTPAWVDKLLVFGWLPLLVVGVGAAHADAIARVGNEALLLQPVVDTMLVWQGMLLLPSMALAGLAIGSFLFHEGRQGFRNAPRLSAGLGLSLLNASMLVFDPIKVFIAYGFSHAVEYIVFVWAYQRVRYAEPLAHDPLLGRLVRNHGLVWWVGLVGGTFLVHLVGFHSDDLWIDEPFRIGRTELWRWVYFWAVYQSMTHFYWDSLLWKIRRPAVAAYL